jgi:Resolvase, N terminal domain
MPPIDAFEHVAKLRRRDGDDAIGWRWPDESSAFQTITRRLRTIGRIGVIKVLYCRVSTADQSCARQERDLTAFATRAGYEVIGIFKEMDSGAKLDRAERRKAGA